MKKFALLLSLFLCLPLAQGFGQAQNAQFQIQATVLTALTVTVDENLNFGDVIQGLAQYVEVDGTTTYPSSGGQSPAKIDIIGAPNREVSVVFSNHSIITDPVSNQTMSVTYIAGDAEFVTGTGLPAGGGTWNPTTGTEMGDLSGLGLATVYLGGTIAPSASQASGNYSATATVTVTYTGQ